MVVQYLPNSATAGNWDWDRPDTLDPIDRASLELEVKKLHFLQRSKDKRLSERARFLAEEAYHAIEDGEAAILLHAKQVLAKASRLQAFVEAEQIHRAGGSAANGEAHK